MHSTAENKMDKVEDIEKVPLEESDRCAIQSKKSKHTPTCQLFYNFSLDSTARAAARYHAAAAMAPGSGIDTRFSGAIYEDLPA